MSVSTKISIFGQDIPTIYNMKENKYDDERFFGQYSQMSRSVQGLRGAGEWHELKKMLPDFNGKRVLDLGCGFGWHCRYAIERGATFALGIDLSGKMLDKAREINPSPSIEYKRIAIEDFDFAPNSFDIVISSLTFHYLESFDTVCTEVYKCLTQEGVFVFCGTSRFYCLWQSRLDLRFGRETCALAGGSLFSRGSPACSFFGRGCNQIS